MKPRLIFSMPPPSTPPPSRDPLTTAGLWIITVAVVALIGLLTRAVNNGTFDSLVRSLSFL